MNATTTRRALASAFLAALLISSGATGAGASGDSREVTVYDSIPVEREHTTSLSYGSSNTTEFGDWLSLDERGTLSWVDVRFVNWACEDMTNNGCVTPVFGSSYQRPITLNVYEVVDVNGVPYPGEVLATLTESVDIPFRPSASQECTSKQWYSEVEGACVSGYAFVHRFDLSALEADVPSDIIVSVEYYSNVTDKTIPSGWPNSLNVALDPIREPLAGAEGSDVDMFINSTDARYQTGPGALGELGPTDSLTGYSMYMRVGVVPPAPVGGTPQEPTFEPPTSGNVGLAPSAGSTVKPVTLGVSAPQDPFSEAPLITDAHLIENPATGLMKFLDGAWTEFPATVSGTTVTYTITDGGAGDADGVVNGVIVDPAAPFISATFTG